jgi:hypothetical protein
MAEFLPISGEKMCLPPNEYAPPMYVGMGACIPFMGGKPPKDFSNGFRKSDIIIPFLFFLLLVDIF